MTLSPAIAGTSDALLYEGVVTCWTDVAGVIQAFQGGHEIEVTAELRRAILAEKVYRANKHGPEDFDAWKEQERKFREHPIFK